MAYFFANKFNSYNIETVASENQTQLMLIINRFDRPWHDSLYMEYIDKESLKTPPKFESNIQTVAGGRKSNSIGDKKKSI